MRRFLGKKLVVPVAALGLTLSIGSVAFALTGSSTNDTTSGTSMAVTAPAADNGTAPVTPPGASAANPWGNQRSDETVLTGTDLSQVQAAAIAKLGSDSTVVRIETDADGNGAYEAHMLKADGTPITVYLDKAFAVTSVEDQPARGPGGGHAPDAAPTATDTTSTSTNSN